MTSSLETTASALTGAASRCSPPRGRSPARPPQASRPPTLWCQHPDSRHPGCTTHLHAQGAELSDAPHTHTRAAASASMRMSPLAHRPTPFRAGNDSSTNATRNLEAPTGESQGGQRHDAASMRTLARGDDAGRRCHASDGGVPAAERPTMGTVHRCCTCFAPSHASWSQPKGRAVTSLREREPNRPEAYPPLFCPRPSCPHMHTATLPDTTSPCPHSATHAQRRHRARSWLLRGQHQRPMPAIAHAGLQGIRHGAAALDPSSVSHSHAWYRAK